jgi:Ca2+-transporting ATPase
LLPLQILWMELFIDITTSIAYEREPEEPGAMQRPPRPRNEHLLNRGILAGIGLAGGFTAMAALAVPLLGTEDFERLRWIAYTALVIGQVVRAYANRSLTGPIRRLPTNWLLAVAALLVVAAQLAIPLIPPLADAFHASPLSGGEWLVVALIAFAPALLSEVTRTLRPARTWIA